MQLAFDVNVLRAFLEANDAAAAGDYLSPQGETVKTLVLAAGEMPLIVPTVRAAIVDDAQDARRQKWPLEADRFFHTPDSEYLDESKISTRAQELAAFLGEAGRSTEARIIAECEEWWSKLQDRPADFALVTEHPSRFDPVRDKTKIKFLTPGRALALIRTNE